MGIVRNDNTRHSLQFAQPKWNGILDGNIVTSTQELLEDVK